MAILTYDMDIIESQVTPESFAVPMIVERSAGLPVVTAEIAEKATRRPWRCGRRDLADSFAEGAGPRIHRTELNSRLCDYAE